MTRFDTHKFSKFGIFLPFVETFYVVVITFTRFWRNEETPRWRLLRINDVFPTLYYVIRTNNILERFPFVWKNRSFWWVNKWNSPSHWKFFEKRKGIVSDVVLFSHCHRNDRNITEPFASSHSHTMLLGEMRGSFPNIASGKNRSI